MMSNIMKESLRKLHRTFGRIIISELFLPTWKKTIKPTDMGGFAGGTKFVVRNILFKIAADDSNLYGSDEAAAKAAGNSFFSFSPLLCKQCTPCLQLVTTVYAIPSNIIFHIMLFCSIVLRIQFHSSHLNGVM
jgi:hypothetical protein